MSPPPDSTDRDLVNERVELLERLDNWLETPMVVLGFVWLALLVVELAWGLSPVLDAAGKVIWGVFIAHFVLGFTLAPRKREYVTSNWLTVISLVVPAVRLFRIFRVLRLARAARAARGLRLLRLGTSVNRGMRALAKTMSRRGFGYVVALTVIVTLLGAAGMYAFEHEVPGNHGLKTYGGALWWTAMVMVTMGSDTWPQTAEGRLLCFFLALYAFAVFGYVTATLASFFIGRDAGGDGDVAGAQSIDALRVEISALREEVRQLVRAKSEE